MVVVADLWFFHWSFVVAVVVVVVDWVAVA